MPFSQTNRFEKQYLNKTMDEQDKVDETLEVLDENPRYPGLHSHRVQGTKKIWECYIESYTNSSCRFYFDNGKLKRWGH